MIVSDIQETLEQAGYKCEPYGNKLLLGFCLWHENKNSPAMLIYPNKGRYGRCFCKNPSCGVEKTLRDIYHEVGIKWVDETNLDDVLDEYQKEKNKKKQSKFVLPDPKEINKYLSIPKEIEEYLIGRGFDLNFIKRQFIGYDKKNKEITIPIFNNETYYGLNRKCMTKGMAFPYRAPKDLPRQPYQLYSKPAFNKDPGSVYVVEGIFDGLKLNYLGYDTDIYMGSSFNPNFIDQTIRRGFPVLAFDNDKPGQKARENWLTKEHSFDTMILRYNAKDPGDLNDDSSMEKVSRFQL